MFNLSQKKNEAFKALKFGTIISVSMFSFPLPPTLNINMMFKHHLNIVFESFILIKKKKARKNPFIHLNLDIICSCGDLKLNFTK